MKKLSITLIFIVIISVFQLPASGAESVPVSSEMEGSTIVSSVNALNYSSAPDYMRAFIYRENSPYVAEDDTDSYLIGYLYLLNENTSEITRISTSSVATFTTTKNEVCLLYTSPSPRD